MALGEVTRMLYVMNTIREEACSTVGLSKRAASALAILYSDDNPEGTMTNKTLQDRFVEYNASTGLSTKKDASAAKSELLDVKYIEIKGKVSVFGLTTQGRETALKMHQAMSEALKQLNLSDEERFVLRKLVGLPAPPPTPPAKPSTSEKSGKSVRQKA